MKKIAILAMAFLFVMATVSFAGEGPQATATSKAKVTKTTKVTKATTQTRTSGDRPWELFQTIADSITPLGHPASKPTKTIAQNAYDSLEQGFAVSGSGEGKEKPFQAAYDGVPTWDDTATQVQPQTMRGNAMALVKRRGQMQRL